MDEIAHHCTETDETDEPSNYKKNDEEIHYAVHDFGVSLSASGFMPQHH